MNDCVICMSYLAFLREERYRLRQSLHSDEDYELLRVVDDKITWLENHKCGKLR